MELLVPSLSLQSIQSGKFIPSYRSLACGRPTAKTGTGAVAYWGCILNTRANKNNMFNHSNGTEKYPSSIDSPPAIRTSQHETQCHGLISCPRSRNYFRRSNSTPNVQLVTRRLLIDIPIRNHGGRTPVRRRDFLQPVQSGLTELVRDLEAEDIDTRFRT
ncbi:hypothetical protein BJX96DRAFT_127468 [Aspergillus floccosus]